ncbi:MAG: hypothetical protein IPK85_01860 [Gemmatimonadetes bacterium]|nr:hypothetical protein [Gemmatimonadota bacterium]
MTPHKPGRATTWDCPGCKTRWPRNWLRCLNCNEARPRILNRPLDFQDPTDGLTDEQLTAVGQRLVERNEAQLWRFLDGTGVEPAEDFWRRDKLLSATLIREWDAVRVLLRAA